MLYKIMIMPVRRLWCAGLFSCLLFLISSCTNEDTLFTSLSPEKTNIHFKNDLEERKLFNILYYLYYYNGGGVSVGDINNDGLTDIYFTANSPGKNKLYLNKGNFEFEDITDKAGVAGTSDWCSGVTMADVNGDNFLDIYVSAIANIHGLEGRNELFINNGNGTFTESAAAYGLNFSGYTTQTAFFDYDRDGDLDCYILNQSQKPNQNIVDTGNRKKFDPLAGDRFYRNEMISTGDSARKQIKFTDVSAQAGIYQSNLGYGLGLAIADMNNDGWDDIYIGNDFHENDYYYVNNGNGTFSESGAKHFGHYSRFSMGNDVADYNNDGQLDIITVDMLPPDEKVLKTYGSDENADIFKFKLEKNGFQYQCSRNCLQRNNGDGQSFSESALIAGVSATDWSWSALFADFDNDGNKDLFISSGIPKRPIDLDYIRFVSDLYMTKGHNATDKYDQQALDKMPDGSSHPFLFKGDGIMHFEDVSREWGTSDMEGYYNGAAYADLNNDGNLDLIINAFESEALILKNNTSKKSWLGVTFKGDGGNTSGIGAKAYLFQHGKMQYQQLMLTRGFQSSSDTRLHFGLDSLNTIDSMLIVWPNQQFQVLKNIEANKVITVSQKNATGNFVYDEFFGRSRSLLIPVTGSGVPNWQHTENDFTDFNVQYLIPHAQSTRGPKIAVGDVNSDGLDDFYACGARGQPGEMLIQQKSGSFISTNKELFNADAAKEDVDALLFDANGDKHNDLIVVSGGNEERSGSLNLTDRLYINDGKGIFSKVTTGLPSILENKSCVSSADVDKDGDQDLFIGVLANANAYGVPQTSYLLLNNGTANFSIAPSNIISLDNLGVVTDAEFADINKDGNVDLLVSGEWMPLIVYINRGNRFDKISVPNSTGFWQTLFIDDINADGNPDVLAGNWGWNNKFWSGKNGPARLYVSDFDKNGQTDHLLSYTVNDKEYPFLAKDEIERPLPVLKKHYLSYSEYAGVEMKDVFYGFVEQVQPLIAERFGSAVFYSDGKGGFRVADLPAALQLAPIFSFQKIKTVSGQNTYVAAGNFFDVIPYEGKYDAQPLAIFSSKGNNIEYIHQPELLSVKGQLRDLKWLRVKNEDILIVAANNDTLMYYRQLLW